MFACSASLATDAGIPLSSTSPSYIGKSLISPASITKPSGAKLALSAAKDEKGTKVTAKVTDLEKPGEKVTLRLVVCEDSVRYPGYSGARYHRQVVRAMPGGADGFALTKKEHEYSVVVNADDIRKELNKALDEFAAQRGEFPRPDRPLALKNLKVVAFVQDDATNEVLAATQLDVDAK